MRTGIISNPESKLLTVPRLYKIIGLLLVLSVIGKFPIGYILGGWNLKGFGYTELLINFEGGFVRRGLLGEVLLWITAHTGIHPYITITALCLLAFGFVLCFFLYVFRKNGYCWWLIFSPVLCGFTVYIIRKDYILYTIIICMLLLVRHSSPAMWKKLLAFMLGILGLMLHEAFIFFGVPLFALVLLNDRRNRVAGVLMLAVLLSVFGMMCFFKGDATTAQSIIDSWNSLLPGDPLQFIKNDSIGALAWDTKETMLFHLKHNMGVDQLCIGIVYWPLLYFAVYYLITFFFCVFKPERSSFGRDNQAVLSSMFLIGTVCLLPMFTVLSCDYGRLFQYAALTSFAAFFILDGSVRQQIIPVAIRMKVARFNDWLARFVPPGKGLFLLLFFTIGISPYYLNMSGSLLESPIGGLWQGLWKVMYHIYTLL